MKNRPCTSSSTFCRAFNACVFFRLDTLHAQSFRWTLAPSVLPRLLARSLPGLSLWSFIIEPQVRVYNSTLSTSSTRRRCIRVSPIVQDSLLLPISIVWTLFSSSVADRTLIPATDHRLGWAQTTYDLIRSRPLPKRENSLLFACIKRTLPGHSRS